MEDLVINLELWMGFRSVEVFRIRVCDIRYDPEIVTQHILRRSCRIRLYHAGVKIEKISKLLRHDDSHTTYKYLGINIDDMNDTMKILRDFDKRSSLVIFWLHPKGSTNALQSV